MSDRVKSVIDRIPIPTMKETNVAQVEIPEVMITSLPSLREPSLYKKQLFEEIRRMSSEGLGQRAIARTLKISRAMIKKAIGVRDQTQSTAETIFHIVIWV